jgi:hypothetical protein
MDTREWRRARVAGALVIALGAVAAIGTGSSEAAQREIRLIGTPVLIDSNIGSGSGKHHFNAVVQVKNTIPDTQDLTVGFDVMQGGKLLRTVTKTSGIRLGGGVVMADVVLPSKGTYSVKARFVGFKRAFTDDALTAAKIVGKPVFITDQPPGCSLNARVRNPAKDELDGFTDVAMIGLHNGKIVAAGTASLFDDLAAGASTTVKVDYITCVKVDEVRAYIEGS